MKIFILLLTLVTLSSCMTTKKREDITYRYLRENPDKAARFCADQYPAKDSIAPPIYKPADNVNYTGKIDSLQQLAHLLENKRLQDSVRIANGIQISAQEAAETVKLRNEWQKQIDALRNAYKPCKPDTIIKPVIRVDQAQVKALSAELAKVKEEKAGVDALLKETKRRLNAYFWALIGAGVVIAGLLYLKFKP